MNFGDFTAQSSSIHNASWDQREYIAENEQGLTIYQNYSLTTKIEIYTILTQQYLISRLPPHEINILYSHDIHSPP